MAKRIDDVLAELRAREPIFHQPELCSTREALEAYTAPDFWEVGASGRVYTRRLVIETVERRFKEKTEPDTSKWDISDFQCRELCLDTYMVTYVLTQEMRTTRRLSIWRKVGSRWQIVYHQGTVVSETVQ